MTQDNPVGWFEIPVNDLKRAKDFYEGVFEVKLEDNKMGPNYMSWFPMKMKGSGAAGTLIKGEGYVPSVEGTLVYFTAPQGDVNLGLSRAKEKGGKVVQEKISIGEHGFFGTFIDTEGNKIAIHSMNG